MGHLTSAIQIFSESSDLLGHLLLVSGLVMITAYFVMRLRRRRRDQPVLSPHESLERIRQKQAVRGDLETLMVEIEKLARHCSGQLDARTVHLEKLLAQADQRIAELRRLQTLDADSSGGAAIGASSRAVVPDDPLARQVYALADQGHDPPTIARQLGEHVGKVELILALRRV